MPHKGKKGKTNYVSKKPDRTGHIPYSDEENTIWHDLITRQIPMLPGHACDPWITAMTASRPSSEHSRGRST